MASPSTHLSRDHNPSPQQLDHIRQMLLTPPASRPPEFENPLEKIEQLLTCPICLDRYKQPKLLPCHHTFCLPCLDNCADVVHRILKCPECRAEHPLPYDGVKCFQTNYTLTGFLDIHLQATDENAAQLEAYIQRYNLERCKVCDEKANLEVCAHCERRACADCRSTHMEMLKRDLNRMLNQVKRLSNRITEASDGLSKGTELLTLNCETTKDEVREYFRRYYRELKKREEMFLNEIDTFHATETRLMRNLRDVLEIESSNMSEGCAYLEAALKGEREMADAELAKFKTVFSEGLEYLRNFQPDAEELFSKKLRFSAGDDASKLPTAIANFGELTVSLPQFAGRYLPLEQSYLPRPIRIGYESDNYKYSSRRSDFDDLNRTQNDDRRLRYGLSRNVDDDNNVTSIRYRRRQQLEEEVWNRLRTNNADAGQLSPGIHNHAPGNSPWSRAIITNGTAGISPLDSTLNTNPSPIPFNATALSTTAEFLEAPAHQVTSSASPTNIDHALIHAANLVNNSNEHDTSQPDDLSIAVPQVNTQNAMNSSTTNQRNQVNNKNSSKIMKSKAIAQPLNPLPLPSQSHNKPESTRRLSNAEAQSTLSSTATPSTVGQTQNTPPTTSHSNNNNKNSKNNQNKSSNANANNKSNKNTKNDKSSSVSSKRRAAHLRQASSDDTSLNEKVAHIRAEHEKRRQRNRTIAADQSHPEIAQAINNNLIVPITTDQSSPQELKSAGSSSSTTHSSEESDNDPLPIVSHPAPNRFRIICRSTSEQQTPNFIHAASIQQTSNGIQTTTNNATSNNTPIQKQESLNETSSRPNSAASSTRRNSSATQPPPQTPPPQPIPIVHYPGEIPAWIMKRRQRYQRSKTNPDILIALSQINCNNTNSTNIPTTTSPSSPSINNTRIQQLLAERANRLDSTTQRYVPLPPSLYSSDSADNNTSFDNDTNNVISSPTSKTSYQQQPIPPDRRARFRRRAFAMAAEREASNEARLEHKMLPSKFLCTVDYQSKCRPRCVFGKKGSKEGDLNWPRGVTAISGTNEFAVCDSSNHRICIFNTQGRLIRSFGKYGSGNGELDSAAGICSNRLKQLIVSDRYNHRIVVFDLNGQFIRAFGSHGPSNGRFNNPWGVCVDEAGMIYAVDKDNHRVQVFDPNGQFVSKFGSMGSGPGQLHNPQFIAYHKQSQHLYVTDSSNHRICVFDHNGNAVLQFGQEGFHNGQLKFPRGIAVDDQGFVIVADSGNNRVQIFYPNGRFMHCFGTWGVGVGQLKGLEDIALLDHTIVVSDRENHRIQLF